MDLLESTELDFFGSPLDLSSPEPTTPTIFDSINSYIDRAFTLYEKGVDTKIGAANTVLDYPKMIVTAGVTITISVLIYKLLVSNKKKAR